MTLRLTKILNTLTAFFLSLLVFAGFAFIALLFSINNPAVLNLIISTAITLIGLFLAYTVFRTFTKYGLVDAWSYLLRTPDLDSDESEEKSLPPDR